MNAEIARKSLECRDLCIYTNNNIVLEKLFAKNDFIYSKEIVSELDRFIVGQNSAKRSVAVALRNRWRRQQIDEG